MAGISHDLVIVGGGLVGASLARALAGHSLRMAMIESRPMNSDADDDRVIALAYGSRRILEGLGLWNALSAHASPIHRIHISEKAEPGIARLDRDDATVDALGYVIEARRLAEVLAPALANQENLTLICPARLESLRLEEDRWTLAANGIDSPIALDSRLLVAADGARSRVRELLEIGAWERDYGQIAVITRVTSEYPHNHTAFERFSADGPLALLPLADPHRFALVLTVHAKQAAEVAAADDTAFLTVVQARFGDRLGHFTACTARQTWPLARLRTKQDVGPRLAIIGNAAHTLHPIAGQGFNLGLRDVAALAELVAETLDRGADPGAPRMLEQYHRWRRSDQNRAAWFTDGLIGLFSPPVIPLRALRSLGLLAFDQLPPAKRWLIRQGMGLGGRLPRLAQGRPLAEPYR